MATQIKIRRDSYANWFNVNPTLGIGEPGYDTTNRKLKIGDGVTLWRALSYFDDQVTDLAAYAGSIVPSTDVSYTLGSPTSRWQKGFFSGNAVYLGDIKLSSNNGTLVVQRVTNAGLLNETPVPNTPGSVTTDRLLNGSNTVSLAANGNLVTPAFTIPNTAGTSGQVLKWPSSGNTLVWSADNNPGVSGGSSVTTGTTPPVGPELGDLWYDTESGRIYIYFDSSWIDASPSTDNADSLSTLTGVTITSPSAGQVLKYNGTSWINDADAVSGGAGVGTVISVSVTSANGFTGTVATSSSTPAITIATSITGVLKGNGTAISAAVAGTDYQAPITLTTTGSSGAATFSGNTLNIPQYSGGGGSNITWTITAADSNNYTFSGPGIVAGNTTDPVLYLYRGFTYVFVNATGGSHPLAIRVSNGGASYTPGVSGSTTGTQTFEVPMNAPSTLYYQCTIHGGMGNTINIL